MINDYAPVDPPTWESWENCKTNHAIVGRRYLWNGSEEVKTACGLTPDYSPYGLAEWKPRCKRCERSGYVPKAKAGE